MKKCVKCSKRFDDSILICDVCGLYLISDVVSDLDDINSSSNQSVKVSRSRRRVVPIDDSETTTTSSVPQRNDSKNRQTSFEPSTETVEVPYTRERVHSRGNLQGNFNLRNFIRRYYPIIRIVIPVILLIIALIWIVANWAIVSEFLQCCIISGIVGGILLTFLSVRFGHHFNVDILTVGVIGGMIVGCLLKYNILGTATGLSELFMGIGPCIIMIIGIYIMIRGLFHS